MHDGNGKHDAFVKCISDRLLTLDLCSNPDEAEAIAASVVPHADIPPNEDDLENVKSSLIEYFEEMSEVDAKKLVYTAALDAGADISHITAPILNSREDEDEGGNDSDSNNQIDNIESEEDDDDGNFIGEGQCELCERCDIKLTRHHLTPKSTWPRMKKRLWNASSIIKCLHTLNETNGGEKEQQQNELQEKLKKVLGVVNISDLLPTRITHDTVRTYLSEVCLICRQCHSAVHRIHSEWELATEYNTIERLLESQEVLKFAKWANKQRAGRYAK
jgi:hypothetical protein